MSTTADLLGFALLAAALPAPALAQAPAAAPPAAPVASYADLADFAESAALVLRAQVRDMAPVEPQRARGVRPGWARYYVEARTRSLISGAGGIGEGLRYLVDLPLDARGRPPAIRRSEVLLFARAGARSGELQLVAPDAQLLWDPASETRLRAILTELNAPGRPARVTGVREAIHVPGALTDEGETQIFLATTDDSAASITVTRRSGQPPAWGASFSEVVEGASGPPPRETLGWYRLACFLPPRLPRGVNLSAGPAAQLQADADYAIVRRDLGDCPRGRR